MKSRKKQICLLCGEKQIIFMDRMCEICYRYLGERKNRIVRESLEKAGLLEKSRMFNNYKEVKSNGV